MTIATVGRSCRSGLFVGAVDGDCRTAGQHYPSGLLSTGTFRRNCLCMFYYFEGRILYDRNHPAPKSRTVYTYTWYDKGIPVGICLEKGVRASSCSSGTAIGCACQGSGCDRVTCHTASSATAAAAAAAPPDSSRR